MTQYLHGYQRTEQDRLVEQSRMLEPMVFSGVDYYRANHILEIGCGVGAQTLILSERFPHLKITGVDLSEDQLKLARERDYRGGNLVSFQQADATKLPFSDAHFDGVFCCWFLEHVPDPLKILKEVRRTLKKGSILYFSEVLNTLLHFYPPSFAADHYWNKFNELQLSFGGDPFVGARMGWLLEEAGFGQIEISPSTLFLDGRMPAERTRMLDYWHKLMLSGADKLLASGAIKPELLNDMAKEFEQVKNTPEGVFFCGFMRGKAVAV